MALFEEKLEVIEQEFNLKTAALDGFGEEVSPETFYEDIFGDLETIVPAIMPGRSSGKIQSMTIDEAIKKSSAGEDDIYLSGCTFYNEWYSKGSSKEVRSFIIDLDNAWSGMLQAALSNDWQDDYFTERNYAKPTYIVNSGTGLHLYFVLDEPIPCYHRTKESLDQLYKEISKRQCQRMYALRSRQWYGQSFRMPGGKSKYNWTTKAFRIGEKWDIDDLAKTVDINAHFLREYEFFEVEAPTVKTKKPRKEGYYLNKKLYQYALNRCRNETKEGNRYMSFCALTVMAWKCNVPIETLEQDLLSLIPGYNRGAVRKINPKEIYSALKMYNYKAMEVRREISEEWQGWEYKPIPRRGRKRDVHLRRARLLQTDDYPNGEWRNKNGRPSSADIVRQYRESNPRGKPKDCILITGLSKNTVYKWWNEVAI